MICDYGCGQEANHQLKNGKRCCSKSQNSCPSIKLKTRSLGKNNPNYDKPAWNKGIPRTEEEKLKISIKVKKSMTTEVRDKMRKSHLDKKMFFTEEHKRNISKALKGKRLGIKRPKHSEKMKENNPMININFEGERNPNWKGGISNNPYCQGWSILSEEIRDYYNKKCQNPDCCGKSERMTTHHIDYNKENCHPDNLICLCHICNGKANGNRKYHEKFYKELKENENNSS